MIIPLLMCGERPIVISSNLRRLSPGPTKLRVEVLLHRLVATTLPLKMGPYWNTGGLESEFPIAQLISAQTTRLSQ